jgi:putative hemolysin
MLFEILIILLLTVANGIFAASEMAIVSARKARLRELADRGDQNAQIALDVATAPDRFLQRCKLALP